MKKHHFWTIHLDYSIIGIVFALLMIGILSVYVAVSHDYPQMVWPFLGQQLAWIGVGCVISLENHTLSLSIRFGLDGSSSCVL